MLCSGDGPESAEEMAAQLNLPVEFKKIESTDYQLYKEAIGAIYDLTIEIKTINGFITGYLMKKYNIKDKAEFNKYFLGN